MNNKILAFLGPLFVGIVTVVFAYYLNLSKSDVRYTLSEEIPVSFSTVGASGIGNVQQLVIRNIGSAKAEDIVIKISGNITDYKIIKYISSDQVQVFIEQKTAEIVYPTLPPQADFKIIFISSSVVSPSDISVLHSTGQAVDALSVSNRAATYAIWGIYALLIGGYFIGFVIFRVDLSFDSWKSEIKRKKIDKALNPSKPWYVSDAKWAAAHVTIIRELLREEYLSVYQENIANSVAYGILNHQKPEHFSDSDWKEINDLAISRLKDHLLRAMDNIFDTTFSNVIRLGKPERFPKDAWDEIQTKANEKFIQRTKESRLLHEKAELAEQLHRKKPEAIPDSTWQALQNSYRKSYFEALVYDVKVTKEPKSVLEKNDLDILDANQQIQLRETVQQKSKYNDYSAIIKNLLTEGEIGIEKPDSLTDWEWTKIKDFEDLIAQANDIEAKKQNLEKQELELMDKQAEVANEESICRELKQKILKQLEIINDILNDPSVIERVEVYDDTFSPGNWKNLKQVANVLKRRKVS